MIEVKSADFRRATALALKVMERRNSSPILDQLCVRANGALEISGTDMDMVLTARVPIDRPGADLAFMLPAPRQTLAAVGFAGGDTVRLCQASDGLHVMAGGAELALETGCSAEDFPSSSCGMAGWDFAATLGPEHLALIERVTGAVSTEETRYYLNGVFLHHIEGWTYRAVATNGHVLMMADLQLPDATGAIGAGVILPRKLVRVLLDKAVTAGAAVKLTAGNLRLANDVAGTAPDRARALSRLRFDAGDGGRSVRIEGKTIDGTFPDYAGVVPRSAEKHVLVKTADLRRAVNVASVGTGRIRAVSLQFQSSGQVRVRASYADLGLTAGLTIDAKHDCPGFEIGFSGQYLMDVLAAAQGEEVSLAMGDTSAPVLIRNPADTAWTGVLMPMRV